MSKKIIILVIIILILSGGFFWWWWEKRESEVGFILSEEFLVKETEKEKVIEHKKAGFKIEIPEDWQVIKGGDSLFLLSSDFQVHPNIGPYDNPLPEKGCSIEISIKKEIESTSYDVEYSYLKKNIELCLHSPEYNCKYEVIEIDGHKALKNIYTPKSENQVIFGDYVWVKVPKDEKIYIFEAYLFSQDKERCNQEFSKILETVSIE